MTCTQCKMFLSRCFQAATAATPNANAAMTPLGTVPVKAAAPARAGALVRTAAPAKAQCRVSPSGWRVRRGHFPRRLHLPSYIAHTYRNNKSIIAWLYHVAGLLLAPRGLLPRAPWPSPDASAPFRAASLFFLMPPSPDASSRWLQVPGLSFQSFPGVLLATSNQIAPPFGIGGIRGLFLMPRGLLLIARGLPQVKPAPSLGLSPGNGDRTWSTSCPTSGNLKAALPYLARNHSRQKSHMSHHVTSHGYTRQHKSFAAKLLIWRHECIQNDEARQ